MGLMKSTMNKQQRIKIRKLNSVLPELNNCDTIINQWAKELMTLYPKLLKDWHKDGIYHWHLSAITDKNKYINILVSSNNGIINSNIELYIGTVIFISQPKSNEAEMFFWKYRNNPIEWIILKKFDKTSFIVNDEIKQYRQFYSEKTMDKNGKIIFDYDELKNFYNMSLVASCLSSTRKKGNLKSNQNSKAQSVRGRRKAGKIVNGKYVKMVFDSANHEPKTENKTVLDAYKIVTGKYGYKKSLRQFYRDLAGGEELKFDGSGCYSVYCSLIITI